ncbi:hypothetical protein [Novosphingobium sp.]|uniref:hypothetical protein n=1 Tax=Novosphingobium sp. TaxID=1874826 RepID=UPI003D0E41A3
MSRITHVICAAVLALAPLAVAQAQSASSQAAAGRSPTAQQGTPANGNNPAASLPAESEPAEPNLAERVLVSPREPRCEDETVSNGITVCGKRRDNSRDRLPIPSELDSATSLGDGLPRAPDVMTNRITGHSIKLGCMLGGCPPGMLPNIDFRKIPAAPPGSDADRVGHGEIRGN